MGTSGVYQIRNTVSGTRYVGSSGKSIERRWLAHQKALWLGDHHCAYLQAAWNKYGEAAFVFEVIEKTDPADAVGCEQAWMDRYLAEGRKLYNILPRAGSKRGYKYTPEELAAASKRVKAWAATPEGRAAMEKTWEGGRNPELRERRSAASKRGWDDPEIRQSRTAGLRRVMGTPEKRAARAQLTKEEWADPEIRRKRTEGLHRNAERPEYREKMKAVHKGHWQDPAFREKTVGAMGIERAGFVAPDGTIYAPVKNLYAFCREHGLTYPSMHGLVTGKYKQHKGWTLYKP